MTIPAQPSAADLATLHELISQGVHWPTHRRWDDLVTVAAALGCTPADAIYRARDGIWSGRRNHTQTLADAIREAIVR
ncbi:hypothetical protein PV646_28480 [Streptomyces sp. ID05-26A]|nr:hypothetical protein [Streptomyces sp. ID05-26A]